MSQVKKTRRQSLEELLSANPEHAFTRYGIAMECITSGEDVIALNHFQQLLSMHPDYLAAYYQYGQLLKRLGRTAEAFDVFRAGIGLAQKVGNDHAGSELQAALDDITPSS